MADVEEEIAVYFDLAFDPDFDMQEFEALERAFPEVP